MFSSFPTSDPPPPRANRIPPRMRAALRSLQMQLHREQGLPGWNKLDRGRSLKCLTGSRPPGSVRKPFGGSSDRHVVDVFFFFTYPGDFFFLTSEVFRSEDDIIGLFLMLMACRWRGIRNSAKWTLSNCLIWWKCQFLMTSCCQYLWAGSELWGERGATGEQLWLGAIR